MSTAKKRSGLSRRGALKGAAAACIAGAATHVRAADATTMPAVVTPDDLAGAGRMLGHGYTDAQHKQMLGIVGGRHDRYIELRKIPIDPNTGPAMRFDPRLPGTKVPISGNDFAHSPVSSAPSQDDLHFATVGELAEHIRSRKLTSTELTKRYLTRLKEIGPKLKCVVNLTEERALREAARADEEMTAGRYRGPLHGVPYGAKDLLAARGAPTTWGVSPYRDRVFDYDATVVERLERAGAVLVAKLSLGELAMGDVWFGGMTRTPWNLDEGSGGSSAGPGAAVAAGLVAFAIGSETLGSIVSPCVACGVTGLRPTYGRLSRFGAMPLCQSMDKLGPMTRCVEDCATVLHAIHGADGRDVTAVADVPFRWDGAAKLPTMTVGVDKIAFDTLSAKRYDKVRDVYTRALDTIRSLNGGAELVPVTLPPTTDYAGIASMTIAAEAACNFAELVRSPLIDELVQQGEGSWPNVFRAGTLIPAADYLRAQQLRTRLQHEVAAAMNGVDVFVTLPFVGPQSAYTNLTGHPSLVTRCGFVDDRPKMIEFIGHLYREDQLLALCHAFERATDAHDRWPRV